MARVLTEAITITKSATTAQVTGLVNNVEEGYFELHYMVLLEDGTPYQRHTVRIEGHDKVKGMFQTN